MRPVLDSHKFVALRYAPVIVVEANLLHDNVAEQVPDCDQEGGQLIATLVATPHRQWVHDKVEERTNHKDVQSYQLQSLFVLLPTHLYYVMSWHYINIMCTHTVWGKGKNCNTE